MSRRDPVLQHGQAVYWYYPHTTGILKNADDWTKLGRNFVRRGYHCTNIGKIHMAIYYSLRIQREICSRE